MAALMFERLLVAFQGRFALASRNTFRVFSPVPAQAISRMNYTHFLSPQPKKGLRHALNARSAL